MKMRTTRHSAPFSSRDDHKSYSSTSESYFVVGLKMRTKFGAVFENLPSNESFIVLRTKITALHRSVKDVFLEMEIRVTHRPMRVSSSVVQGELFI